MKRQGCALLIVGSLLLGACTQQQAPEHSFKDPSALPYINAQGGRVEVQLPAEGFVSASMVIDAQAAQYAAHTSDNVARSAVVAGGVVGLLMASAINTRTGTGALERHARLSAQNDTRPMVAVFDGQNLEEVLLRRYQQSSQAAGLPVTRGQASARLLIESQMVLNADRSSFVLVNRVQIQDIAGSVLYRRRVDVAGKSFRQCGTQCIDDGQLELAKVNEQLEQCIDEAMRVLAQDLHAADSGSGDKEQTIRYVLDGQRVVERGRLLPPSGEYHRYRNLDGAIKSVPVPFENVITQSRLP